MDIFNADFFGIQTITTQNVVLAFLITKLLAPAVVLVIGLIVMKILMGVAGRFMTRAKANELLRNFVIKMVKMVCIVLLVMTVLALLGVPTTSFVALIGALGLAIALSWQSVLANFAGGVMLLINRPFDKGDYIDDLQVKGTVVQVDLFFSTLETDEGQTVIIPNNRLANTTIINYHKKDSCI